MRQNAKDTIIKLYSNGTYTRVFSRIRFWDAPYEQVEKLIPKTGRILELGCGEGLFSNFIALSSSSRKVQGIEIDKVRFKNADKSIKNASFLQGDITKIAIPKVDVIVLFHVLHHLRSYSAQSILLSRCASSLQKKGTFIIVEVEPQLSLKYATTWFTDHFLVPWLFEKRFYSPIFFRSANDWKEELSNLGFEVKVKRYQKGMPFSHIVYECIKIK